jgi:hypothetical protein
MTAPVALSFINRNKEDFHKGISNIVLDISGTL